MKIISIANQKGGSGKTTTSVNVSAWLAARGNRTLLIDLDPQANATSAVADPISIDQKRSIGALLEGDASMKEVIHKSHYISKLHFIPATIELSVTELELTKGSGSFTGGVRLKDHLKE